MGALPRHVDCSAQAICPRGPDGKREAHSGKSEACGVGGKTVSGQRDGANGSHPGQMVALVEVGWGRGGKEGE